MAAHDYWVATVNPYGRPHLSPVGGLWGSVLLRTGLRTQGPYLSRTRTSSVHPEGTCHRRGCARRSPSLICALLTSSAARPTGIGSHGIEGSYAVHHACVSLTEALPITATNAGVRQRWISVEPGLAPTFCTNCVNANLCKANAKSNLLARSYARGTRSACAFDTLRTQLPIEPLPRRFPFHVSRWAQSAPAESPAKSPPP